MTNEVVRIRLIKGQIDQRSDWSKVRSIKGQIDQGSDQSIRYHL